jgi:hypothetical protein
MQAVRRRPDRGNRCVQQKAHAIGVGFLLAGHSLAAGSA